MVSWDKIQVKLQNCHLLFSILLEVDAKAQFNVRQLNAFLAGYGGNFWDGRVPDLAEQGLQPAINPNEMAKSERLAATFLQE